MLRLSVVLPLILLCCAGTVCPAQTQSDDSPAAVVKQFYQQMRARRYVEGFRLSVYGPAVETLAPEELRELEADFIRIAEGLPDNVETRGEQISGDTATVFVKLPGTQQSQGVTLVKIDGHWRVGDKETWQVVRKQGRDFFFNARISISEQEAAEWLEEIFGAETIYFQARAGFTTLEELIRLGGISKQLANGSESGYRFTLHLESDGRSFTVQAIPAQYGRTGRRSFYMDQTGVIRAEDRKGQPADVNSPRYQSAQATK